MLDFNFSWLKPTPARHKIKDLSAETMAHAATALLRRSGKNINSLRLLYHALVIDSMEVEAFLRLTDIIRDTYPETRPRGNGLLAGVLLEWMGSPGFPRTLSPENKILVIQSRYKMMRVWGFSKSPKSQTADPLKKVDEATLEYDELGYIQFLSTALDHIGSYQAAFEMAHETIGYHAGLLQLKTPGPLTSFMDGSHFTVTPAYKEWLAMDAAPIERALAQSESAK